jgi:phage/plasmid-associated DNA primase
MFNITENYIPEHTMQQENQELINYMQELIGMMTTEDEEMNRQNIVMLVDEIFDRLEKQGIKAEKDQIRKFLEELKRQQESSETN